MQSTARRDDTPPEYQEQEPILCRCARWRRDELSDHRDWRAELRRALAAGMVPDDVWFAAMAIEARLDSAERVA